MEVKVVETKENKTIGRKELTVEIIYDQKPLTRIDAIKEIAKLLKVGENLIILRKMNNVFGTRKTICDTHVYSDEKTLKKFEPKYLVKRIEKSREKAKPKEESKEGEQ